MQRELLEQLYQRYAGELRLYLRHMGADPATAEDLVQETFCKAILSLPDSHANVRAWLYMVARNLYYNYRRDIGKRETLQEEPLSAEEKRENTVGDPEETLLESEKRRLLTAALQCLESQYREVILLQYLGGFSQKQIAAILHISPGNVRVRALRARQRIRHYMEEKGYDVSGIA